MCNICVYMLDGERPCSNSESRHFLTYTHTRVYGMRPWRGWPHADASVSLAAKKGLYKPNLELHCF